MDTLGSGFSNIRDDSHCVGCNACIQK